MTLWVEGLGYYAKGSGGLNVFSGATTTQVGRAALVGTDRMNLLGSGRLMLSSLTGGGVNLESDMSMQQFQRVTLLATTRVTLTGTGELRVFDYYPVGRLVLAGRGG